MATRKKDVVQADPTPKLDQNAATSDGAPRPNADPATVAAESWFDKVNNPATIAAIQNVKGDIEGTSAEGWTRTATAAHDVAVDVDQLLNWYPDSGDAFDKSVSQFTYSVKPDASAAAQKLLSSVIFHAVCASTETNANLARYDNPVDNDAPKYQNVRKRFVEKGHVVKEKQKPGVWYGDEAACKAYMAKQVTEATTKGDTHEAGLWQAGLDAIDDVKKLRRLGADLANIGIYKTRYRCIFYVNVCQPLFDTYVDSNPAKPLADLWRKGLIAAGSAHKKYMNQCAKDATAPTAEGLNKAIKSAVWDDFLAPNVLLEKKLRSEDEEREAALNALFRAAEKVDSIVTGARMVEEGIKRRVETLRRDLPETAALIYDPKAKAKDAATQEANRVKEEREAEERAKLDAAAKATAQQEEEAKALRKAEREAKKASEGPTPRAAAVGAASDNGVNVNPDKRKALLARAKLNQKKQNA